MSSSLVNHQVRLAKRPEATATRENWKFTTEPVGEPAEGGVLIKTLSLSLDPAMRGWLNDAKSYIAPVAIDEVMRAGGIGRVIASKNPEFAVGDTVYGMLGVQEYTLIPQDQIKRNGLVKIDLRVGTINQWLNVLGMPGMTGYFGLMDVGQPKPGETVVISGAAGAVGQTVGQLAKIKGCRVVGIAGGLQRFDGEAVAVACEALGDALQHRRQANVAVGTCIHADVEHTGRHLPIADGASAFERRHQVKVQRQVQVEHQLGRDLEFLVLVLVIHR
jgi:NADPH-dependent curcumin reductase CurA